MTEPKIRSDAEHANIVLGTERRVGVRIAGSEDRDERPTTSAIKDAVDTSWYGTIRDVSACGIAMIISRHFEPGTDLIVELSAKPKGILGLPVRVVHATPDKKGRWIIGCAFCQAAS